MKYRRTLFLAVFTLFLIMPAISLFGVNFSELNLSLDDRLLFKAEFESRHAVFLSTLNNNSMQQLTVFPEKLQIVDNGRSILVMDRFGMTKVPTAGGLPAQIPGYPSFAQGNMPLKGRLQEAAASNDGRWVVYIEPTSPAYGTLFIVNTSNGTKRVVSERVELPARDFPVKWSPDSRLFVYEKDKRLYYFPILSDLSVLIDERFRLMGQGSINSIIWGQRGEFFYFNGNSLYQVRNPELFTRTIYGDFLSIGNTAITIPFEFDSSFDRYWTAPDSRSVLISKNEKGMFLFFLGERTGNGNSVITLPHIALQPGAENITVLWAPSGKVSIIYSARNSITAAHFEITQDNARPIQSNTVPLSSNGALSPDGSRALFWGEQGLELWDFTNWRLIQKLKSEPVLSCAWINNGRFVIGTAKQIEEINISGSNITQRRICLSSADEIGFETITRGQSRVLARVGTEWYATDTAGGWTPVNDPQLRQVSLATDRYRVFLERNIPMVRNLQSVSTTSLLSRHTANRAYPQRDSLKIALCFDLYDDDTGLYYVLSALRRNNIRATFFLNGDFIRRNPHSASAIAEAGHETASMFYAPIDLSDSRYRITREFIVQGLARNEDEFYNATGKELGLLWHPPFYRTSEFINSAALSAGYVYIPRTLDLQDWVSREESARLGLRQVSPSENIEQITGNRRTNAVIPVRLGLLSGGRDEYLYQRIDVLLDALARSGIEIIPVSDFPR